MQTRHKIRFCVKKILIFIWEMIRFLFENTKYSVFLANQLLYVDKRRPRLLFDKFLCRRNSNQQFFVKFVVIMRGKHIY